MREPETPPAEDVVRSMVAKLITIERRTTEIESLTSTLTTDVAAIGKIVGKILETPDSDEEPKGQRDWLTVTDPGVACRWLQEATEWLSTIGAAEQINLPACWPLHPLAVAEILALAAERAAAYKAAAPLASVDYLGRCLPGARSRLAHLFTDCARGVHVHGSTQWTVRAGDIDTDEVATWWATDRDRPAPEAFLLART